MFDRRGDQNYQPAFTNNSSLEKSENGTPVSSAMNSNYISDNFEQNSADAYRLAGLWTIINNN